LIENSLIHQNRLKHLNTRQNIEQKLTVRELEILNGLMEGKSRGEIATTLSISVLTYDEHRKNIRNKLGLRSTADWASVFMLFIKPKRLQKQP
jgi:DNA-binding NarL/FixJ family response regulator